MQNQLHQLVVGKKKYSESPSNSAFEQKKIMNNSLWVQLYLMGVEK